MRKKAAFAILVLLVVIQVFRPAKTNPPVDPQRTYQARLHVPPEVARLLERSCKDCHSHSTSWPWYAQVAPVSWLVVSDVQNARRHMNLSEWAKYDAKKSADLLDEMCEVAHEGEMPLWSYTIVHKGTKLSRSEAETLCAWARSQGAEEGPHH